MVVAQVIPTHARRTIQRASEHVHQHKRHLVLACRLEPLHQGRKIAAQPLTCWADSRARFGPEWLSPPNGMKMTEAGLTFIWMSDTAAVQLAVRSLARIVDRLLIKLSEMLRSLFWTLPSGRGSCAGRCCRSA